MADLAPADEGHLSVLLVDDSLVTRRLVRHLLGNAPGVRVVAEAGDGQEALSEAAAHQPDLIVLDMEMPVLSGLSALPLLRQVTPSSRVVVLSALSPEEHETEALAAGAAAYIQKGTDPARLGDEILTGAGLIDVAIKALHPRAHEAFPADLSAASQARAFARRTLLQWSEQQALDTVELLLSELVTNAVVHASSSPDVALRLLPDRLHVEVTDRISMDLDVKPADDERESGRGLALVEALSTGWGTASVPGGKLVWFDVSR